MEGGGDMCHNHTSISLKFVYNNLMLKLWYDELLQYVEWVNSVSATMRVCMVIQAIIPSWGNNVYYIYLYIGL